MNVGYIGDNEYYKISKKRLLELLEAEAILDALESGGVDNWEWYGMSRHDFLNGCGKKDFDEFAEDKLCRYPKIIANKYTVKDVVYTLQNYLASHVDYQDAANAATIVAQEGFGVCFPIDDFISSVKSGFFIDYDGTGYFVDKEGKQLSCIHCDSKWLEDNTPADAFGIMWYNK